MKWAELVERTRGFLESMDVNTKLALICDSDPDGIGSAVVASHAIRKINGVVPTVVIPTGHNVDALDDDLIASFKQRGITHLLTTDLAFDQKFQQIRKLESICRVLVLDHHKIYHDLTSKRTILIKPQLFQKKIDPSQYCTSKLSFDLFSELVDLREYDWIAVIGILADSNFKTWTPFVKKTLKRLKLKLGQNPFANPLGRICNLMAYYEIFSPGNVSVLYNVLVKATSYKRALNSDIIKAQKVNDEVEYYLKHYQKFAQVHGDLLLIRIKPKFKIGSIVATRLSNHLEHTTIVIAQEMHGRMFVSARRQDFKVAVNDLLEQSVKEIKESSAGGHIPAAGAKFPLAQYDTFSKRIIKGTQKKK